MKKTIVEYLNLYPQTRLEPGSIALYAQLLSEECTVAEVRAAMNCLAKSCKYFPTVAEIIKSVREDRNARNERRRSPDYSGMTIEQMKARFKAEDDAREEKLKEELGTSVDFWGIFGTACKLKAGGRHAGSASDQGEQAGGDSCEAPSR